MKLQEAMKLLCDLSVEESRKGIADRRLTLLEIRALDAVLGACLTPEEITLVSSALDSFMYWELGDVLPRNNGYLQVEAGETWEDFAERYPDEAQNVDAQYAFGQAQAAYELDERLAALQKEAGSADQPPAAE